MENYFVQYKNELQGLALAAVGILFCILLFIYALVKVTKCQNKKIRNAQTMELPRYMKMKNSMINLFFSIFLSIGMVFFIALLVHIVDPTTFSLKHITESTIALYSFMLLLFFMLFSCIMDILHFFTSFVTIEDEVIYIQYLCFKKYVIHCQDVESFEVRRGVHTLSLPVAKFKFLNKNMKKRNLNICLTDESNILLLRYFQESK